MRDGFRIIDADRHVVEPLGLWARELPPELRAHAPRRGVIQDEPLTERLARLGSKGLLPIPPPPTVAGKPLWSHMSERAWIEFFAPAYLRLGKNARLQDPAACLADMDRTGVDIAVLYPSYALLLEGFVPLDPPVATAFARIYNTWLHGYCSADPRRLRGAGLISLHEPAQMVPELLRVIELGFRAVVVRPNPIAGRILSDPAYEPFWDACERRSIAVGIHDLTQSYVPSAGSDRFTTRFSLHACAHPMEQMMALLCLIEGGVLERHPALRVAALEAGCGWLPYWLWRLDELSYGGLAGEVEGRVLRAPSAYFRQHYFASLEPGEPGLAEVVRQLGDDNLFFGSDYPHLDHATNLVDAMMALREQLPDATIRKILWDNPARFYGIEG